MDLNVILAVATLGIANKDIQPIHTEGQRLMEELSRVLVLGAVGAALINSERLYHITESISGPVSIVTNNREIEN